MARSKIVEQEEQKTNMRKLVIKKSISPRREQDDEDFAPLTLPRMSWAEMLLIAGNGENRQRLLSREYSIDEWRDAVMEVADHVLKENVALMAHVPDDYDERDKYLRTEVYNIEEILEAGECTDVVKLKNGEWNACPANSEVRLPIKRLENVESLCQMMTALLKVLDGIWRHS